MSTTDELWQTLNAILDKFALSRLYVYYPVTLDNNNECDVNGTNYVTIGSDGADCDYDSTSHTFVLQGGNLIFEFTPQETTSTDGVKQINSVTFKYDDSNEYTCYDPSGIHIDETTETGAFNYQELSDNGEYYQLLFDTQTGKKIAFYLFQNEGDFNEMVIQVFQNGTSSDPPVINTDDYTTYAVWLGSGKVMSDPARTKLTTYGPWKTPPSTN